MLRFDTVTHPFVEKQWTILSHLSKTNIILSPVLLTKKLENGHFEVEEWFENKHNNTTTAALSRNRRASCLFHLNSHIEDIAYGIKQMMRFTDMPKINKWLLHCEIMRVQLWVYRSELTSCKSQFKQRARAKILLDTPQSISSAEVDEIIANRIRLTLEN